MNMKQHVRKSMHIMRRVLSLVLAFVVLFTSVDVSVFADEVQTVTESELLAGDMQPVTDLQVEAEPPTQAQPLADEQITIRFWNTSGWGQVSLYNWDNEPSSSWPGSSMSWDEGLQCYTKTISVTPGKDMKLIFNNNNQGSQTSNLILSSSEIAASKEWWFFPDGSRYSTPSITVDGQNVTFSVMADKKVENESHSTTVKIYGTLPNVGWSSGTSMTKSGNVFTKTVSNLPVDVYAYKFVVNGNWQGGSNSTFGISEEQVTLHFNNKDKGWNPVYAYIWQINETTDTDPDPKVDNGWPGNLASADKNNYFTTTVDYYGHDLNMIFNNGSSQTSDLKIAKNDIVSNKEFWVIPKSASSGNCDIYPYDAKERAVIAFPQSSVELKFNETVKLTPTVHNDITSWVSGDESVVTVDGEGNLTPVGLGTATITITTAGKNTASCNVTVVEAVSLNKTELNLVADDEVTLSATIAPEGVAIQEWESSVPSVATVDANGKVTALAAGTTTITVTTANGESASCIVNVTETISLNHSEVTLEEESFTVLTATAHPSSKTVTWSSDNEAVAEVDQAGKVSALSVGTAVITAAISDDVKASCTVTVTEKTVIPANSVTLDKTEVELVVGATDSLTATTDPEGKAVEWTSNKESVATVDEFGNIAAVAAGTAVITAKADEKTATCTVTVVDNIELNKEALELRVGKNEKLEVSVLASASSVVTWASDDEDVATVNAEGVVTAVSKGTATITATTAGGATAECTVTVSEYIRLETTYITLTAESEKEVTVAETAPSNAEVTWTSEDENVATVDNNGKVTAVGAGRTKVIATTAGGATAECTVEVNEAITLSKSELTLVEGEEEALTAEVKPSTAEVTWKSSKTSVATVDEDGKVTAVAPGSATITATTAGKDGEGSAVATCEVTVTEKIATYTIYAYTVDPNKCNIENAAVYVFDSSKDAMLVENLAFTETETLEDGRTWLKATYETGVTSLGFIFKSKGSWSWQTANYYVDNPNKDNKTVYLELVESPVVVGDQVTFNYVNADATSAEIRGTMNDWGAAGSIKLTKHGDIFTGTATLAPGKYEYKIVYNGDQWIADPLNKEPVTEGDGNSTFIVTGFANPVTALLKRGESVTLPTSTYYVDASGTKRDNISVTYELAEAAEHVTLDGNTLTLGDAYAAGEVKLKVSGTVNGSKVSSVITCDVSTEFKYTFYVYTDDVQRLNNSELYIWDLDGTQNITDFYELETEVIDEVTWLKTSITTTAKNIGFIFKAAGGKWEGWQSADYNFQNTAKINQNLYIVDGMADIYHDVPSFLKGEKYTYTIYAYSPVEDKIDVNNSDLWVWNTAEDFGKAFAFTGTEKVDGRIWLKAEIKLPYKEIGFLMREKGSWEGWKTADYSIDNTTNPGNPVVYIVDGHEEVVGDKTVGILYDSYENIVMEENYVYVEYVGESYNNKNLYTWGTGYSYVDENGNDHGLFISFREREDGTYVARIPVKLADGETRKSIGFLVLRGQDWNTKEGGDNFYTLDSEIGYGRIRFGASKIIKDLTEVKSAVINRKNGKITFNYRDNDVLAKSGIAYMGDGVNVSACVMTDVGGVMSDVTEMPMTYDKDAQAYTCQLALTGDADYYYYFKVNGAVVTDENCTRSQEIGGVTCGYIRNKVYNVTVTADIYHDSMDYNDNNVISVAYGPKTANDSLEGFNVEHIYLDLSELGLDSRVEVDKELKEFTFGCSDKVAAGTKNVKVIVVDDCEMEYIATAQVNVTERNKGNDFDWDEAVIYFAVTDRFYDGNTSNNTLVDARDTTDGSRYHGGDLAGLTAKLDYLADLGVNTIWITPIVDNIDQNVRDNDDNADGQEAYAYHGYWTSDFKALNPHLGTETELETLITKAHEKGMKIMVDVVLNHAGYGTEDYFNSQIDTGNKDGAGNTVYKPMIREDVVEGDDEKMSLSGLPDFVTEDPEVRALLIEWQTSWMSRFDIDYYRVDTVKHVDDTTWQAFKNELTKIDPTFKLIGEYYDGGYRNDFGQSDSGMMDSILDFHFNDVMTNLASENLKAIEAELMKRNELLSNTATMGSFLSSHDENGFLYDLVNHHGESEDWAKALMKVAATYQITAKGQPVIYYGEEIGLTGANNYPVQDNRYDFNWSIANDSNAMYKHYKKMLNIRKEYSEVFAKGERYAVVTPEQYDYNNNSVAIGYDVFARTYEGQTIYVGTNVWGDAKTLELFVDGKAGSTYKDLYNGNTYTVSSNGSIKITIPGAASGGTAVIVKTTADGFVKEDKNEITLKLHYKRNDNNYSDWNAWMWADTKGGARYDFEDVNGEKVATITVDGRNTNSISFRIRLGDWKQNDHQGKDQTIDISDIVSGTVHYYVEQDIWGGVKVLGGDVIVDKKVTYTSYTRELNTFTIVTNRPISGSLLDAFEIKCLTDNKSLTIVNVDANGSTYTVTVEENIAAMKEVLKTYALYFDGYEYTLAMPNIYSSKEFETAYTYDGKDLGLTYSKEASRLKVWAPTADKVVLNVYESGTAGTDDLIKSVDMTLGEKGVWSYILDGDWNGTYYTYTVSVNNETNEVCDPYARTTGVNGKRAMILDLDSTDPEDWSEDTGAHKDMEYTDAVIYELHVRDLSIDDSSGVSKANQGKFLGLTETGTTTSEGTSTGLDHMIDLGVTHVHLLPVYDYASVDESKLDTPQFNWGYDPLNYNVPEGSYSTDPYNGEVRVREMKEMVQTLHENNINVIMDVVYNHVYDAGTFGFNVIVPSYFSRTNADGSFSNGSGCGNDTATERSMVHKYVVESILYWHDEYHIDGFRFDLVGLLDTVTINKIVEEVHKIDPDIIFYGEGWTLGTAVSKEDYYMATQANAYMTPDFAYFSDTIRNGVAGTDTNGQGFIWGTDVEDLMRKCFTATTDWCPQPNQTINYVSCHDNYTLMDKINEVSNAAYNSYDDAPGTYQTRLNNLAASFYMLSEGIPLIHAGEEFLRTKLEEGTNTVIHNSYNASDYVNKLRWYNLDGNALYADTVEYYEGLIEFRKNHEALRLSTKSEVAANVKYHWVTNDVILFTINGKDSVDGEVSDGIVVIFNASDNSQNINLYNYGVESGTWKVCIDADNAGTDVLSNVTNGQVNVPYKSVKVLVKGETVDTESVYTANNKVTIDVEDIAVGVGQTRKIEATVNPANSTLVWKSANTAIATVDEDGKVTGVAEGTTTFTVSTLHGVSATFMVTVTAEAVHAIELVEAKAPTCTTDGNIEYYYCELCGECYADEAGTTVLEESEVILPATGTHVWKYVTSDNVITASCVSDAECTHANGVSITLTAARAAYTGKAYEGLTLENAESFNTATGNTLTTESVKFYSDEACTTAAEPINVGVYYAVLTVGEASAVVSFEIYDEIAPTASITVADDVWAEFLNRITFGLFFKETQKVTITAEDNCAVDTVYYYVANEALTLEEVKALEDTEWTLIANGGDFNIEDDNTYVIYAKVSDTSGNMIYISSDGLVIDTVAPVITEITDGAVYCEAIRFGVTESYMDKVTVDGTEVTADVSGYYTVQADGEVHTIVVTDKAGNSVTYVITVNDGHTDADKDCECDYCTDKVACVLKPVEKKEPTCTESGTEAHYICENCETLYADAEGTQETTLEALAIEATGHTYGAPVFTWASDFKAATATFTCENDEEHVATETATVIEVVTKEASDTENGEITYTATVIFEENSYTDKKQKKVALVGREQVEDGTINAEVRVAEDVVDVTVENFEIENMKEFFTEEEMQSIEEGAEVRIYLEVTNINETVQDEHKDAVGTQVDEYVEELVAKENLSSAEKVDTGVAYFDFSLYKEMEGEEAEKLEETGNEPFVITINIPEEMKSDNEAREYFVVRVHGTIVTMLETIVNRAEGTLTFTTDRFSTYAVVYAEPTETSQPVYPPVNPPTDEPSTEVNPPEDTEASTESKPSTGSNSSAEEITEAEDEPATE